MQILLSAQIDKAVSDVFLSQAKGRGFKKKAALESAVKLWTSLPPEIQARLMDSSLEETTFIELIHQIVDERVVAGYEAAEALVKRKRQKRKPAQKGRS